MPSIRACGWKYNLSSSQAAADRRSSCRSRRARSKWSICASKKRIEEELQEPVWHFAYPNGRLQDISDFAREAASTEGFRTAVTTQYGHVTPRDDRFLLKRMVVEPDLPEFWFEEILEMFRPQAKGIAC